MLILLCPILFRYILLIYFVFTKLQYLYSDCSIRVYWPFIVNTLKLNYYGGVLVLKIMPYRAPKSTCDLLAEFS